MVIGKVSHDFFMIASELDLHSVKRPIPTTPAAPSPPPRYGNGRAAWRRWISGNGDRVQAQPQRAGDFFAAMNSFFINL
jgi:hypothetical protein